MTKFADFDFAMSDVSILVAADNTINVLGGDSAVRIGDRVYVKSEGIYGIVESISTTTGKLTIQDETDSSLDGKHENVLQSDVVLDKIVRYKTYRDIACAVRQDPWSDCTCTDEEVSTRNTVVRRGPSSLGSPGACRRSDGTRDVVEGNVLKMESRACPCARCLGSPTSEIEKMADRSYLDVYTQTSAAPGFNVVPLQCESGYAPMGGGFKCVPDPLCLQVASFDEIRLPTCEPTNCSTAPNWEQSFETTTVRLPYRGDGNGYDQELIAALNALPNATVPEVWRPG